MSIPSKTTAQAIKEALMEVANNFEAAGANAPWTGREVAEALRQHAVMKADAVLSNRDD